MFRKIAGQGVDSVTAQLRRFHLWSTPLSASTPVAMDTSDSNPGEVKKVPVAESEKSVAKAQPLSELARQGAKTGFRLNYSDLKFGPQIAQSSSSVIFEATWQHQQVAVKGYPYSLTNQAHNIRFSQKECQNLRELQFIGSEAMIGYAGAAVCPGGLAWPVMEFSPHGTVKEWAKNKHHFEGGVPRFAGFKMLEEIAGGLADMHANGYVHGDPKGQNALRMDEDTQVKLIDFGHTFKLAPSQTFSDDQGDLGTLVFMAPESHEKNRFGFATDNYAMGGIAYQMIDPVGLEYEGFSDKEVKKFVVDGKRPKLPSDCPPSLAKIITSLWAPLPSDRMTAAQARDEFHALAENYRPTL